MTDTAVRIFPPGDFLKRATEVARYYGFRPLPAALAIEKLPAGKQERVRTVAEFGERHTAVSVCLSCATPSSTEPLMYYYLNFKPRSTEDAEIAEFSLEVLGTLTSIGEAMVMKAAAAIFEEVGVEKPFFCVNSVGDRESQMRFMRELSNYYRKHIEELPGNSRLLVGKDPLRLIHGEHERLRALREHAPRPVTYLSESCRRHFKEVLEYLERMGVAYTISDYLFGSRDYYTKTVFEIMRSPDTGEVPLACGGRYDELVRRLGVRRDAAGVGVTMYFRRRDGKGRALRKNGLALGAEEKSRKPKVCFVQVGFEAKLKSLTILDMLRRAHVPVYQSLHHDRLSGQLSAAEAKRVPYLIILGQREALSDTVIVRNIATRAQTVVAIAQLPSYLKNL